MEFDIENDYDFQDFTYDLIILYFDELFDLVLFSFYFICVFIEFYNGFNVKY